MLRFSAPIDGYPYGLHYLNIEWWGPRVLLALPQTPFESCKEYDVASISSAGYRRYKDKPYFKLILDGDLALVPDKLFGDEVFKIVDPSRCSPFSSNYGNYGIIPCNQGAKCGQQYRCRAYPEGYTVIGFSRKGSQALKLAYPGVNYEITVTWEYHNSQRVSVEIQYHLDATGHQAQNPYVWKQSSLDSTYGVWEWNHSLKETWSGDSGIRTITYGKCESDTLTLRGDPVSHTIMRETGSIYTVKLSEFSPAIVYPTGIPAFPSFSEVKAATEKFYSYSVAPDITTALYPATEDSIYSSLQEKAISGARIINTNMLMFIRDIADLKNYFEGLANGVGKTASDASRAFSLSEAQQDVSEWLEKHGEVLSKDVADVYLPVLYGYGLTMSEAKSLGERLSSIKTKWRDLYRVFQARARCDVVTALGRLRVNYLVNLQLKDNAFSRIYATIFNAGLWPSLESAWDFVPYSFCADWFVSINDMLRTIDLYAYRCNLDARSVVRSYIYDNLPVPATQILPLRSLMGNQALFLNLYRRWVTKEMDPPPFSISSPLYEAEMNGGSFSHYTEGAALIVQRI